MVTGPRWGTEAQTLDLDSCPIPISSLGWLSLITWMFQELSQDADQGNLRAPAIRDVLPSLSLCLVPNHVVCCFSMTQGEAGIKHMVFRAVVSTPCHAVRSQGPCPTLWGVLEFYFSDLFYL